MAALGFAAMTTMYLTSLRRYVQIIIALLDREWESRRREPLESIANLLEPVILIGTLSFFWWFLGRKNSQILGGSPVLFYATGFFAKYFFIYVSRRMPKQMDSPGRRLPVEHRLDHIFAHMILRVIDYTILGFLVFGIVAIFITDQAIPHDMVLIWQSLVALLMLAFGWGIFNIVMTRFFWIWAHVVPAVNRGLILISGAMFVPDFMAPSVRDVLVWNPVMHAIALFRMGFYQDYPNLLLDTHYLAGCCVAAVAFGLVLERATRRREK
jgi:capsular polysaccharide transport system permease protein